MSRSKSESQSREQESGIEMGKTFDFGGMEVEKTQLLTFDFGGIENGKTQS